MTCQYFNERSCVHQKSHETKGTLYKHICAACFASQGKTYPHPETECRNKLKEKCKKRVGLGMCLGTHAQSVHVDCVTSRVFYNKNLQAKHEYFCQRVPNEYLQLFHGFIKPKPSNMLFTIFLMHKSWQRVQIQNIWYPWTRDLINT